MCCSIVDGGLRDDGSVAGGRCEAALLFLTLLGVVAATKIMYDQVYLHCDYL